MVIGSPRTGHERGRWPSTGPTSRSTPTRSTSRVNDGQRSSGRRPGVTAGIDLTLALVERDHRPRSPRAVARQLVMFLRRPGGQSQFAAPAWIRQAPAARSSGRRNWSWTTPGRSQRPRARPPGRHERTPFRADVQPRRRVVPGPLRRPRSRRHGTASARIVVDTVEVIARRCGFGSAETMRRTLVRHIGVSPEAYRQRFHQPTPP